jgi:predicted anti-sigma-YlaC factor YlaD
MTNPDADIPCQELVELVTDYLEGRLNSSERQRFEAHLAECSGCQAYLDQMHMTLRIMGSLAFDALGPEAREELLGVYHAWKRS